MSMQSLVQLSLARFVTCSWDIFVNCDFFLYMNCNFLCCFMQDPTKQTEIDNFMVQQLDGTVNEWGWCKQKVRPT